MAATFVQSASGDWVSGTTWNTSITATSGNCLVAVVQNWIGGASTTASLSDGVNTYTSVDLTEADVLGIWQRQEIYVAKNITGGSLTCTTTISSNSNPAQARTTLIEISGADTTAPTDVFAHQLQTTPGTSTDAVSSSAVSTTVNGEVVVGATMTDGGEVISSGTGFTTVNGATYSRAEYLQQSTAGSIAATFTGQFGNFRSFRTSVVTIKPASGGGGTTILDPFGAAGVFGA